MNRTKYFIHILILLVIQLIILDNIQLNSYLYVNIYILIVLIAPYHFNKMSVLLIGFFTGLLMDFVNNTMGIHTASATLIAYVCPKIAYSLTGGGEQSDNLQNVHRVTHVEWLLKYVFSLVFFFNVVLIFTEAFSFANIKISLLRILYSSLASAFCVCLYYLIALRRKSN